MANTECLTKKGKRALAALWQWSFLTSARDAKAKDCEHDFDGYFRVKKEFFGLGFCPKVKARMTACSLTKIVHVFLRVEPPFLKLSYKEFLL